jgi:hypothetical protein
MDSLLLLECHARLNAFVSIKHMDVCVHTSNTLEDEKEPNRRMMMKPWTGLRVEKVTEYYSQLCHAVVTDKSADISIFFIRLDLTFTSFFCYKVNY